jgi:hypothetical protein
MAKPGVGQVNTTDNFQAWLDKTNEIVTLINTDIMTASVLGDTTTGNATLVGSFTANTVNVSETLSANTASVLSLRNRDSLTSNINVLSPVSANSTERNILSLTSGPGPLISLTNAFPLTWTLGMSSSESTSEFQISRGGTAVVRVNANGLIVDGAATINQNLTVLGSITGNITTSTSLQNARTIAATTDVAWSVSFDGSTDVSAAATIQTNAVSNDKFRQSSALSVVGRSANSTGNVADIAAASDHQVLRRAGSSVGFGAINLTQSAAVTGALPVSNGGTGQSSFVAGRVLFGGTTVNSDTALFWDNVNKRLGVNTTTPTERIDVNGNVRATLFIGRATSANYADLAEKFEPDQDYPAGTVVYVGGEKEITSSAKDCKAIGVVSEFPALMMNADQTNGIYVALKGRVPVFVVDKIKKGDILVPSDNGKAEKGSIGAPNVLGIALSDSKEGKVEILVL